ncbi:hypothetical protein GCM10027059_33280 [Myceligenerans halotolerans]
MGNSGVLEAGSADAWASIVSNCFVPLSCIGFEDSFAGRMEHTALGAGLSVSLVTTSGTSAEHTERLARGAASDDLHLSLQRSSRGVVSSGGHAVAVRAGSVSVYPVHEPYYLDYSPPDQQQLIVQVSRASLGLPAGMLDAASLRIALPGGARRPAAANLFSYVAGPGRGGTSDDDDDGEPDELAAVTRDLAAVMIQSSFTSAPVTPHTAGGLRHSAQEHLRRHAADRHLSLDDVAHRHGVSRRKLYQVFEPSGTTPAAFLRRTRLRTAAVLLSTTARSVTEIAYASGFDTPETFTRAFRREHGTTPRDWRFRG